MSLAEVAQLLSVSPRTADRLGASARVYPGGLDGGRKARRSPKQEELESGGDAQPDKLDRCA
jgi:hypothetical protein